MGTQILTGSKGFTIVSTEKKAVIVTQDTCCECESIPIMFTDTGLEINIKMSDFIPDQIKQRDY